MPDAVGLPPVVAVVGPTAVGKSAVAVAVCEAVGGEVVNADSMQLYRGMDIGTAKVSVAERRGVPHQLLDVWDVTVEASVAEYQRLARAAVADVRARGAVPVLVGGSGLYVAAVLDAFDFPGTDPQVRRRWEDALERVGAEALHRQLAERDPAAAAVILPSNGRRVVRALEVGELRGSYVARRPGQADALTGPVVRVGLTAPRDVLDRRVAERVDRMWDRGLVEEVRALVGRGLREGPTARKALGYAQVLALLDGAADEAGARAETVRATRRYVRRQESWFRRDASLRWYDAEADDPVARIVHAVRTAGARPSS